MQPGDVVLERFVAAQAGQFNAEDDVDLVGADRGLEAAAFYQVLDFTAGGAGVAVIVDFDLPALGFGV